MSQNFKRAFIWDWCLNIQRAESHIRILTFSLSLFWSSSQIPVANKQREQTDSVGERLPHAPVLFFAFPFPLRWPYPLCLSFGKALLILYEPAQMSPLLWNVTPSVSHFSFSFPYCNSWASTTMLNRSCCHESTPLGAILEAGYHPREACMGGFYGPRRL